MESYRRPEGTRILPVAEKDQEIEEQETKGFVDMNEYVMVEQLVIKVKINQKNKIMFKMDFLFSK